MRTSDSSELQTMLDGIEVEELNTQRDLVRQEAKEIIKRIQEENVITFNKNRTGNFRYGVNEAVAIKRTQFGVGTRLRPKYLGPYKIVAQLPHGRYEVKKIGIHEGPNKTITIAENIKKWG